MDLKQAEKKSNLVLNIIFSITLALVLINLFSAMFPAFLIRTLGNFTDNSGIDVFTLGIWFVPLLITNISLFGIAILYYKNLLSKNFIKAIKFILNFETSKGLTAFIIIIIIGTYIVFSVSELNDGYFQVDYYRVAESWLENYEITNLSEAGLGAHFGLLLTRISMDAFGNYKIIPFIASISLLVLTYFFTATISKKRFAGLVSLVILLQSNIFLRYDTSVAFTNFWVLFYLLSLFCIVKFRVLSPVTFALSALSKGISAAFLPITFFFIYRQPMPRTKKIRLLIYYTILFVVAFVFISQFESSPVEGEWSFEPLNMHDFWTGFNAFHSSFRFDGFILLFILPLVVTLFFISKKGVVHADSVMFMIMLSLMFAPLMQGFADLTNTPYRFMQLIVFFAIGIGLLFSKNIIQSSKISRLSQENRQVQ